MVHIDSDKIELYYPVSGLTKFLHNRSAYMVRKFGNGLMPFKEEDTAQFNDILKRVSVSILGETYRFSKELTSQMEIKEHVKAEEECIIFYLRPDISNPDSLNYADVNLELALHDALVHEWFSGTAIEEFNQSNAMGSLAEFRSAILNLRVEGKTGRNALWL